MSSSVVSKERTEPLLPWIAFLGILIIYLAFPTRNYFFDGIEFAHTIEGASRIGTSLIHPNHLIYNLVGYLFYKLLTNLGFELRAIAALQILNSILSVLCAGVLFLILKSTLRSLYISLCLTLLFSFSATWWKFSTDADAYIASILFLLISFYLVLPGRKTRPFLVALTFSFSMLFHQLAVIFCPVIMLGLVLQTYSRSLREKVFTVLKFGASAFILTLGAYSLCFFLASKKHDFLSFLHWITSFSPDSGFNFNLWSALTYSLRGHGRLFFGGRFNLIKGLINPLTGALMFALAVIVSALIYVVLKNLGRPSPNWLRALQRERKRRSLVWLSLTWVAVYLVFLFCWMPQHTFYRLFYLPALILLAGMLIESVQGQGFHRQVQPRKFRLAMIVATLSISNFLFLIFPYSHEEKFPPLAFAREMNHAWPTGTVIYYAMGNSDNSLFRYFNPATTWKLLDTTKRAELENELKDLYSKGVTAWLDYSAIYQFSSTPEGAAWLSSHTKDGSQRELKDPAFRIRFIQIIPETSASTLLAGSAFVSSATAFQNR